MSLETTKHFVEERRRKHLLNDFSEVLTDLLNDESLHHTDAETIKMLLRVANNRRIATAKAVTP